MAAPNGNGVPESTQGPDRPLQPAEPAWDITEVADPQSLRERVQRLGMTEAPKPLGRAEKVVVGVIVTIVFYLVLLGLVWLTRAVL